jgi:hypothetical protein
MNLGLPLVLFLVAVAATTAAAEPSNKEPSQDMGTPEQRAACASDVRRFCRALKTEDGPFAYLDCLQQHREKLRPACVKVISGGMP